LLQLADLQFQDFRLLGLAKSAQPGDEGVCILAGGVGLGQIGLNCLAGGIVDVI